MHQAALQMEGLPCNYENMAFIRTIHHALMAREGKWTRSLVGPDNL
jgi:hypothetical protein